ncbi:MAG: hypothetical protein IT582_05010 [Opitutaceae bacterium]|nr:hypothetical protein [Opitutaceae bacterium]
MPNIALDMNNVSIRTMQHRLAAMIAITRRNVPVARLMPVYPAQRQRQATPPAMRAYWRDQRLPLSIYSTVSRTELMADKCL